MASFRKRLTVTLDLNGYLSLYIPDPRWNLASFRKKGAVLSLRGIRGLAYAARRNDEGMAQDLAAVPAKASGLLIR